MFKRLTFTAFQQWFTVMEHYNRTNCTVSDLIIGNSYSFRVFSENPCGLSEKPAVSKDVAHIKKSGRGCRSTVGKTRLWKPTPSLVGLVGYVHGTSRIEGSHDSSNHSSQIV